MALMELSDNDIKYMLDAHEEIERSITNRSEDIIRERSMCLDKIEINFLKSYDYTRERVSRSYHVSDPVYDAYIRITETGAEEKLVLIEEELNELLNRQQTLTRVCTAYHRLKSICPVAYNIMYELHYKPYDLRKYGWDSLSMEMHRSKRYFSDGLALIRRCIKILYDSEYATAKLFRVPDAEVKSMITQDDEVEEMLEKY